MLVVRAGTEYSELNARSISIFNIEPTGAQTSQQPTICLATMSSATEEAHSAEEATEDATEQQEEEDATTAADDKWIHSAAKKSLRTDIILGKVTTSSDPKDVYVMHNSHKGFPFENFKTNLQSLLKAVAKDIARMQHDCEAYGHDLAVVRDLRFNEGPGSRPLSWHLSEAREFLKLDMAAGKHKNLKPKELWLSRPEYQVFDLEPFRKAIHAAEDKKAKLVFRMEKKKFRAPPPATPAIMPTIPLTFGAKPQQKKGKGRQRKPLT
jgi:hypothetical protein